MKKITFLLSIVLFWGFFVFSIFLIPLSILSFLEYYLNWNIPFVDIVKTNANDFARISIIGVEFKLAYTIILMWGTLIFYAIYFYVLKNFFKIFVTKKYVSRKISKKTTHILSTKLYSCSNRFSRNNIQIHFFR